MTDLAQVGMGLLGVPEANVTRKTGLAFLLRGGEKFAATQGQ